MPGLTWDEVAAWGGGGKERPKGVLGDTAGAPAWQCLLRSQSGASHIGG